MTSIVIEKKRNRNGVPVLNNFIDALTWEQILVQLMVWGGIRESRTVCLCNVHSSVTATKDKHLANALSSSDMVLPDGAPIAWMLRRKGFKEQTRIAGPDLMLKLCDKLQNSAIGVFLLDLRRHPV